MSKNILDLIDNDKLINLSENLFVLCDFLNPSGSIKDKAARYIIDEAFKNKIINKDSTIIESTSGNMGIALAVVCNYYKLKLVITMPENMSIERAKTMKYLGAKVILTNKDLAMKGANDEALRIYNETKNSFMPSQFTNIDSVYAHYYSTAISFSNAKIDIFVCGFGSGGTISGVAKRLKEENKDILIVGVEPKSSPLVSQNISGSHLISGIGANFIPSILRLDLIDEIITVSDEEALSHAKILAREYGLLVGISSGANYCAMLKLQKRFKDKKIGTVLPDSLFRYLSTNLLDE